MRSAKWEARSYARIPMDAQQRRRTPHAAHRTPHIAHRTYPALRPPPPVPAHVYPGSFTAAITRLTSSSLETFSAAAAKLVKMRWRSTGAA